MIAVAHPKFVGKLVSTNNKPDSKNEGSKVHHDFIMVAEGGHKLTDSVCKVLNQTSKSAALRAFRATRSLSEESKLLIPKLNKVGDLRGMVLSKSARSLYDISFKYAEKLEPLERRLVIASVIIEIARSGPKYRSILGSKAPPSQKGLRLALQIDLDALRGLTGLIPDAAYVLSKSLEGYVQLGGLVGIPRTDEAVKTLQKINYDIHSAHEELTDPDGLMKFEGKVFNYIRMHLNVR